jgi:hypothetical protein
MLKNKGSKNGDLWAKIYHKLDYIYGIIPEK